MVLYVIIGITIVFSMRGFRDRFFSDKYLFQPGPILHGKEWVRMLSSGLLHVNWMHLGFNMYALYTFSSVLFGYFTEFEFVLLYLISLIAGNALALFIHRNHHDYRAVGASGAVSGIIYASIVLAPYGGIGLIFLPGLWIPSWVFGIIFILYSIFGIRSQGDNIGHEAHLGGAIAGLLLTVLYFYSSIELDYWVIGGLLLPTLIFLYLMVYKPHVLKIGASKSGFKIQYPTNKKGQKPGLSADRQRELNRLLEKIDEDGLESLSMGQRRRLDELSRYKD